MPVAIVVAGITAGAVSGLSRIPLMIVLLARFMLVAGPTKVALIVLVIVTVMIVTPPLHTPMAARQAGKKAGRAAPEA